MGRRIRDRWTDVPGLTRQRRWQLRQRDKGRCMVCGRKALTVKYCRLHRDKEARARRKMKAS